MNCSPHWISGMLAAEGTEEKKVRLVVLLIGKDPLKVVVSWCFGVGVVAVVVMVNLSAGEMGSLLVFLSHGIEKPLMELIEVMHGDHVYLKWREMRKQCSDKVFNS
jgi:hypothetical protein